MTTEELLAMITVELINYKELCECGDCGGETASPNTLAALQELSELGYYPDACYMCNEDTVDRLNNQHVCQRCQDKIKILTRTSK